MLTVSAIEKKKIEAVWGMISSYQVEARKNGWLAEKRTRQSKEWMHKLIHEMLLLRLRQNASVRSSLPDFERKVMAGRNDAV